MLSIMKLVKGKGLAILAVVSHVRSVPLKSQISFKKYMHDGRTRPLIEFTEIPNETRQNFRRV